MSFAQSISLAARLLCWKSYAILAYILSPALQQSDFRVCCLAGTHFILTAGEQHQKHSLREKEQQGGNK